MQCRTASQKLFGEQGERVALQMVASVHGTVAGLVLVAIGEGDSAGGCLLFDQIASPDPIWGSYRDRGYDSLRSGPRGWPRRSRSARKRRSWPSTYRRFGRLCRDFRSRSLREAKADRRRYKASVSMGFAWHPRRRRKLPTSRPFSWTSDNGRVDAALAPVDVPCRSTRRARHIRADWPLTNNTGHSSSLAESGRLVRRTSHRVDPAAIAEEARTVRLDVGPPRRSVPVGDSSTPKSRTLTSLIMVRIHVPQPRILPISPHIFGFGNRWNIDEISVGLAFGRSRQRQPETKNALHSRPNGRRVSRGRFRVVGCGAFRLDFDGGLGGEAEETALFLPVTRQVFAQSQQPARRQRVGMSTCE